MRIKPYLLIYWLTALIWYIILLSTLFLSTIRPGSVILINIIGTFLLNGIIDSFEGIRFLKYLQRNYSEETKTFNINTVTYSPMPDIFQRRKWLKSNEDFGDQNVRWFKKNARNVRIYMRITFYACAIFFLSIYILN